MEAGEGGLVLGACISDGKIKNWGEMRETADLYRFDVRERGRREPAATKMADLSREKGGVVAAEQTGQVMMRE